MVLQKAVFTALACLVPQSNLSFVLFLYEEDYFNNLKNFIPL